MKRSSHRRLNIPCSLFLMLACIAPASAQSLESNYTKAEYDIPMRDGVTLHTVVYSPRDKSQPYPILLKRTPYGAGPYGPDHFSSRIGPSAELQDSGYIFVHQDVRGKGLSQGEFLVMKPYQRDKQDTTDVDESSDNYDTVDWLIDNIANNNSKVGQWGISYPGWQTVLGMIDAHPNLVASSPQASPSDMFIGDDFHHNGAFRLMYTFSWLAGNAQIRTAPGVPPTRFRYPTPDGYRFFLELGPIANINERYFQGNVPTWNEYMAHGTYDDYWKSRSMLPDLRNVNHAILNVAGWFDAEDFYGPMSIYGTIEELNPHNKSTLVVGPWRHGGWSRESGQSLGHIQFGSATAETFRREIELKFFEHHLKGEGKDDLAEAIVFETGSNEWKTYDTWPPAELESKRLYFHPNGRLSFDPPSPGARASAYDEYVSDPDKPVPFSARTLRYQGHIWKVEDQRFAASRPDVLVYESDVLTEDVTISGPIIAHLFVSTTGTDSDWIVKLIDVLPPDTPDPDPNPTDVRMGHFQMMLASDVIRGKFRNSMEHPEPMTPGEVTPITLPLRDRHHTFLAGHRIMVQVQSTWFPLIDRNPQTFVDIYHATEADFQKATQRVYRSGAQASCVEVGVLR